MARSTYILAMMGGLAALTAGCATVKPAALVPAATAEALEHRSLDEPRLQAFLAASGVPVEAGRPWDLQRLSLAALYFHPDIDLAYARLAAAQAAVATAHQRPNPSVNLSPQFNATTMNPTAWTVGTAVNLLVETFGKRGYRTDEARRLAEAAQSDLGVATWQVRGRVRGALLELWAAQQREGLAERRLALQAELVGLLERRQAAGEASGLDVAREHINRDQFALAVQDARRDVADARAVLATAIGVPIRALDGAVINAGAIAQAAPPRLTDAADLRRRALTGRADIQSSLSQYAAAESAVQLQVASQYPNIALAPGYAYDQGDNKFSLAATFDLPIFNQNQGPIAQAVARRRLAAASFLALQAQVLGQVDRAWAAYQTTSQSRASADALLAEGVQRQARTAALFRAGQIDRPALLAGDLEVAAGELARLQALAAQRQALGQVEDALQQPVFAPTMTPPPLPARTGLDAEPSL